MVGVFAASFHQDITCSAEVGSFESHIRGTMGGISELDGEKGVVSGL